MLTMSDDRDLSGLPRDLSGVPRDHLEVPRDTLGLPRQFAPEVFARRRRRALAAAAERGIGAVVLSPGEEFHYLTGSRANSHERLSALVLSENLELLLAPATDAAELAEVGIEVRIWHDGDDPVAMVAQLLAGTQTIAVGGATPAAHLIALQAALPAETSWQVATRALAEVFSSKEAAEIEQLRAAGAAIDRVHDRVPELLRSGRTEADIAAQLHELIAAEHHSVDFVIVGSGPNGAHPHHSYSDRVLTRGEAVVVDIGGTVGAGYHSDCTRTYIVDGIDGARADTPAEVLAAYEALEIAQRAARELIAPGISAAAIDAAARDILTDAGVGHYFTHRTGHGIGLSLHEEPFIMAGNDLILTPGMTFSVEPGLYLPGRFGMRLEDIVLVTPEGYESLNNCPRQLR